MSKFEKTWDLKNMDVYYMLKIIFPFIIFLKVSECSIRSAVVGHDALLPCTTDIVGSMVRWFDENNKLLTEDGETKSDDNRISVDHPYSREYNLKIENVRMSDQGNYSCYITSGQSKDRKHVYLEIHYPPTITSSSDDVTLVSGSDVTLECEGSGSPEPQISWYKHTVENQRKLLASNSTSYSLSDVTKSDASVYECEANNNVPPMAVEKITVDVQFVPIMTLPYQKISQKRGRDTLLDCLVTGNPISSHYWMRDGVRIVDSDKFKLYTWEIDQYTQRLGAFLMDVEDADFGDYVCVAENKFGKVNETMQLIEIVTSSVEVTHKPEDIIARMHKDIIINCTVEGLTHRDNLIWWRNTLANGYQKLFESSPTNPDTNPNQNNNNKDLSNKGKINTGDAEEDVVISDKIEVVGHYNLLVKDVSMQDGGVYGCEIVGSSNYTAQITIVDNVTCSSNETHIQEGEYMNISCLLRFSGHHRNWDVTWQHNERKISSINHDSQGTILRLVSFRSWATDSGLYTCNIDSLHPHYHSNCQNEIIVKKPPQPVVTVTLPGLPTGLPARGHDGDFNSSMLGLTLGVALVAITLLFLVILAATVKYYRKELAKYNF